MKRLLSILLLFSLLTLGHLPASTQQITAVPALMNFQGRLARPDGTPVANGNYNLQFSLYNALTGGTLWWQRAVNSVPVRNGTFAARLDFSSGYQNGATQSSVFAASAVYLEIKIGSDAPLTPRQQFLTVAYAMKADSVRDGSITSASIANGTITAEDIATTGFNSLAWLLGGNLTTNPATHFLGTGDNQPLHIRVNNRRAMRYSYAATETYESVNILGGVALNSISAGVEGATIAGGGQDNVSGTDYPNRVLGDFGTVSGGFGNTASGASTVVGGGFGNQASNTGATIAGGLNNAANHIIATVGGGQDNIAGNGSTVAGGLRNNATQVGATIGGGLENVAGNAATVAGGYRNNANQVAATISGGTDNTAGNAGTVAGGTFNTASGVQSSVGGGFTNTASGAASAIPGGASNVAAGAYSFAAGRRAKANHNGAFVWADSVDADFASTAANQFLIRAGGGVGINISNPAGHALYVNGSVAGVGAYNNVSDARYKQHIVTFPDALDTILNLRGVTFDWKQKEFPDMDFTPGKQIGFIAQEVEKILPELVTTDQNGYKSVAYANIVPVLVEAVKTLKKNNDSKDAKIVELEARLERLEAALNNKN